MQRLSDPPNGGGTGGFEAREGDGGGTRLTRRRLASLGTYALAAAGAAACAPPTLGSAPQNITPRAPKHPIDMTILDGSGDLAVYQAVYSDFAKTHPHLVRALHFQTAAAPDVLGKLRAQALSDSVGISLILGGSDIVGALQQQRLLTRLLPRYQRYLPDLTKIQDKPRRALQSIAHGYGIMNLWGPSGPAWAYDRTRIGPNELPRNPRQLLAWAKAHPGRMTYAQPPNSGPGRQLMMSLAHELGDKDPSDPVGGWDRTWAYLRELGGYTASYPASSTLMNKQLADGSVWLVPTSTASDFNNHRTNVWGADQGFAIFDDQAWIMDGHFHIVPRGVSPETLYVDLAFISWVLQPAQQLRTFASGTLTPANATVRLSQASEAARATVRRFGRVDYLDHAFTVGTLNTPLEPLVLTQAFDLWQRRIGSQGH
ncbi:ABC transporter substrate-binding protein [Streptomyces sulfonofaciens]|uniref:ABC transporter substrate-binding protein n=1 Tax=Streptomyces sulfonofaciens TaxID=68272 RepID=A0A919L1Y7_9ACTN|nr:extracellular solute-binding protein [Streptomyces sulfonofaciens]GHH81925.1 ABC transporter substrate-binding protein [Streptomyces sulfonofaciens]